jgi:hypothetical protein
MKSLQNVFARYARNAVHIVTVNCGARRQSTTTAVVFAISLSSVFFIRQRCAPSPPGAGALHFTGNFRRRAAFEANRKPGARDAGAGSHEGFGTRRTKQRRQRRCAATAFVDGRPSEDRRRPPEEASTPPGTGRATADCVAALTIGRDCLRLAASNQNPKFNPKRTSSNALLKHAFGLVCAIARQRTRQSTNL